jgi:predicted permease
VTAVLRALLPLFALIALGYVARLVGWPKPRVWRAVERITYYVLFPALLFTSLATTSLAGGGRIAAALAVAAIATAMLALSVRKPLRVSGTTFSSVLQGAIRPNTYVGVGAALALWGSHGVALAAVGLATVIPIVNVISVIGLIHYVGGGAKRRLSPVAALALNPLILSCFAGLAANGLAWHPPAWVMGALKLLGQASLPLGLLAVGAALQLSGFRARLPAVGAACAFKLAVAPTPHRPAARPLRRARPRVHRCRHVHGRAGLGIILRARGGNGRRPRHHGDDRLRLDDPLGPDAPRGGAARALISVRRRGAFRSPRRWSRRGR